ncbi:MAG: TolC family protein [Planctomycetaceae bacterium]|nr:TolC family protein [Planctomycetaceae bacterium]
MNPQTRRPEYGDSACPKWVRACAWGLSALTLLLSPGCPSQRNAFVPDSQPYIQASTAIEYPALEQPVPSTAQGTIRPVSLTSEQELEYWDLRLEEALHLGMTNSQVFRDIGGVLLRSPGSAKTSLDPATFETDPRFGTQAALSAFDATFASSLYYENNDRALNNVFFGGGTRQLRQKSGVFQAQINKRTPFGSEFSLRHNVEYDQNNAPGNQFTSAWDTNFEAEYRQALLRGAGTDFGRIAGTSRTPGVYNGVLIARTNTDVAIADFEVGVRDFLSDIENAYWDLYFAYRDLDAKIAARDSALETWRRIQASAEKGRIGGEADKEAEAREQYYRFQEEVENALTGRLTDGTRTHNGSSGGTFRPTGGVHVAERRLRYLIGLPVNDGQILRPADEPLRAEILFNWDLSLESALTQRPELRRQKWVIKKRELELVASRNFLKPELDVVAQYRWRGFGDDLISQGSSSQFSNAWSNLVSGDFQESQLGVELAFPIGNRQAHAGVRHAEFQLARDQALLREQEQRVVHDLSNALAEVERSFRVLTTVASRREAALDRLRALTASYELDKTPLNLVLDAQRRLAAAESHYYAAVVEYNAAVKNMHYEQGTLLTYNAVHIAEGPWPNAAFDDAADKLGRRVNVSGAHLPDHRVISTGASEF